MTKSNWLWIVLLLVVAGGLWYFWQNSRSISSWPASNQTTNTTNSPTTGTTSGNQWDTMVASILQASAKEQIAATTDAGESALVQSISQRVSDLSQVYNENNY